MIGNAVPSSSQTAVLQADRDIVHCEPVSKFVHIVGKEDASEAAKSIFNSIKLDSLPGNGDDLVNLSCQTHEPEAVPEPATSPLTLRPQIEQDVSEALPKENDCHQSTTSLASSAANLANGVNVRRSPADTKQRSPAALNVAKMVPSNAPNPLSRNQTSEINNSKSGASARTTNQRKPVISNPVKKMPTPKRQPMLLPKGSNFFAASSHQMIPCMRSATYVNAPSLMPNACNGKSGGRLDLSPSDFHSNGLLIADHSYFHKNSRTSCEKMDTPEQIPQVESSKQLTMDNVGKQRLQRAIQGLLLPKVVKVKCPDIGKTLKRSSVEEIISNNATTYCKKLRSHSGIKIVKEHVVENSNRSCPQNVTVTASKNSFSVKESQNGDKEKPTIDRSRLLIDRSKLKKISAAFAKCKTLASPSGAKIRNPVSSSSDASTAAKRVKHEITPSNAPTYSGRKPVAIAPSPRRSVPVSTTPKLKSFKKISSPVFSQPSILVSGAPVLNSGKLVNPILSRPSLPVAATPVGRSMRMPLSTVRTPVASSPSVARSSVHGHAPRKEFAGGSPISTASTLLPILPKTTAKHDKLNKLRSVHQKMVRAASNGRDAPTHSLTSGLPTTRTMVPVSATCPDSILSRVPISICNIQSAINLIPRLPSASSKISNATTLIASSAASGNVTSGLRQIQQPSLQQLNRVPHATVTATTSSTSSVMPPMTTTSIATSGSGIGVTQRVAPSGPGYFTFIPLTSIPSQAHNAKAAMPPDIYYRDEKGCFVKINRTFIDASVTEAKPPASPPPYPRILNVQSLAGITGRDTKGSLVSKSLQKNTIVPHKIPVKPSKTVILNSLKRHRHKPYVKSDGSARVIPHEPRERRKIVNFVPNSNDRDFVAMFGLESTASWLAEGFSNESDTS